MCCHSVTCGRLKRHLDNRLWITMYTTVWRYKGTADEARLRGLQTNVRFNDIAALLNRDMEIRCCHTRDCDDKAGYKRTIYCVKLNAEVFDSFFNSRCGYRGPYFQSPDLGLRANEILLQIVRPRLLAWMRTHCPGEDPEFAAASISSPSAKAWLAEKPLSLCARCEGEWDSSMRASLEITNGRWECDSHIHAQWGRQAYLFSKVRFIGAFLNSGGEEYVAPHKLDRAHKISKRGWA
jgi:hypothetical protein